MGQSIVHKKSSNQLLPDSNWFNKPSWHTVSLNDHPQLLCCMVHAALLMVE